MAVEGRLSYTKWGVRARGLEASRKRQAGRLGRKREGQSAPGESGGLRETCTSQPSDWRGGGEQGGQVSQSLRKGPFIFGALFRTPFFS